MTRLAFATALAVAFVLPVACGDAFKSGGGDGGDPTSGAGAGNPTTSDMGGNAMGPPHDPSCEEPTDLALFDNGLVARYFIDEAREGQLPGVLRDDAPSPLDIPLDYSESPFFQDLDCECGLQWIEPGASGRAVVEIAGTKVKSALEGATRAMLEVVMEVDAVSDNGSAFVHIGRQGPKEGRFTLWSDELGKLYVSINGEVRGEWDWSPGNEGRVVVHIKVETNLATPEFRVRAEVNGTTLPNVNQDPIPQGETFELGNDPSLALGNANNGFHSFEGKLNYVALYSEVLIGGDGNIQVDALIADDDHPPPPGTGGGGQGGMGTGGQGTGGQGEGGEGGQGEGGQGEGGQGEQGKGGQSGTGGAFNP